MVLMASLYSHCRILKSNSSREFRPRGGVVAVPIDSMVILWRASSTSGLPEHQPTVHKELTERADPHLTDDLGQQLGQISIRSRSPRAEHSGEPTAPRSQTVKA